MDITSLILGIVSFLVPVLSIFRFWFCLPPIGMITGVLGIVFYFISYKQGKKNALAISGLVFASVGVFLNLIVMAFSLYLALTGAFDYFSYFMLPIKMLFMALIRRLFWFLP